MNKSESIVNLSASLSLFQGEVANPKNTAINPFYKSKYSPLHEVLNTVKPILSKHGLSVIQDVSGDAKNVNIVTLLTHASGEWIESSQLVLTPEKNTPQGIGSAITYGRRYALSAVLGLASEEDCDANEDEKPQSSKPKQAKVEEFDLGLYLKQLHTKYGDGLQEWASNNNVEMVDGKRNWSGMTQEQIKKLRSDLK